MSAQPPTPAQIAQLLAELRPQQVERVAQGGSTWVYQVTLADSVAYLRVLPEAGASFAPEVLAHQRLAAAGVRVPAVLRWEHINTSLGASIMLTAELPGRPLAEVAAGSALTAVLMAAGRDLAQIHRLPVDGFGWVDRRPHSELTLRGAHPSLRAWLEADLAAPLATLEAQQVIAPHDAAIIRAAIIELDRRCAGMPARLVHGDFDPTHIFVDGDGYSGLIDFGEIRGAHPLYDLGHLAVEHANLLPPLRDRYAATGPLSLDSARQIELTALLIAARQLGQHLARRGMVYQPDLVALRRGLSAARL